MAIPEGAEAPEEEISEDNQDSAEDKYRPGFMGRIVNATAEHASDHPVAALGIAAGASLGLAGAAAEIATTVVTSTEHLQHIRSDKTPEYTKLLEDRAREKVGDDAWDKLSLDERFQLQLEEDKAVEQEILSSENAPQIKHDESGQVSEVRLQGEGSEKGPTFVYDNPNEQKDTVA